MEIKFDADGTPLIVLEDERLNEVRNIVRTFFNFSNKELKRQGWKRDPKDGCWKREVK